MGTAKVGALAALHTRLVRCRLCPKMLGPVVHGTPVMSPVYLLGQAPGAREGPAGRPFAWTAGRTLFRWFKLALGADEPQVRERVYFAAVARCFPGKKRTGGDRAPGQDEVLRCRRWIVEELGLLRPRLVLPVGKLAIGEVLGGAPPLQDVVGRLLQAEWHGLAVDVICLPHPSGASTWHVTEPGKTLLAQALRTLSEHPTAMEVFAPKSPLEGAP